MSDMHHKWLQSRTRQFSNETCYSFLCFEVSASIPTSLCIRNLNLRLMLSLSEGEDESGTDEGHGFSTNINIVYSNCAIILMRKLYLENTTYYELR